MSNVEHYRNADDWIGSYLANYLDSETWSLESNISYRKADLIIPIGSSTEASKTDAENAKRIHRSLKNLTPVQAMDSRIWTYLTHHVFQEYMSARWLLTKQEVTKGALDRYFANTKREVIRNGIARLWWYGYLTYDPTKENPYELTDFLLSTQNLPHGLLERTVGDNKEWLMGMLEILMKYKDEYPDIMMKKYIDKFVVYLNFVGGVTVLDCVKNEDLDNLFLQWIQKENIKSALIQV